MAEYQLDFTPYQRKDPVTGETKSYIRKGSARQTSEDLKEHQQCVANAMRNENFSGAADTRDAFRQASKQCAGQ